jgi:solute carrier family 66, member 2
MQTLLLYVALTNRTTSFGTAPPPFAPTIEAQPIPTTSSLGALSEFERPYNFWRWRTSTPYWRFLGYWMLSLFGLQLLFGQFPFFPHLLGMLALTIEALLPIPQLLANQTRRSCVGFRLSVLVNWLVGDAFKMVFFLAKGADEVPWAFKICGIFQAACDVALGAQFYFYGDGTSSVERDVGRDIRWLRDKTWHLGQKGLEMMVLERAEEGDMRRVLSNQH